MAQQHIVQKVTLLLMCLALASSFAPSPNTVIRNGQLSTTSLNIFGSKNKALAVPKPTFDKSTGLWEPAAGEQDTLDPVLNSLLRQGPGPVIVRLTKPQDYEQAVLKYQASEGCSLPEAQGNMDAFFNNAGDWTYQKNAEKNGAPKVDYTKLKIKDAVLVLTWAFTITPFLGRIVYIGYTTGTWGVKLDQIFSF
mmetsp:Transcript_5765/g.8565  ORF Transcript_5765/g.8565 Transcript_5765/m.8565 type:complete len:194 (-) Transcript_5765:1815-2396(-)